MPKKPIPEDQINRIKEISSFIKSWRIFEGISQREFADMADSHLNTISNLENNKNVSVSTLLNCVEATGMSLAEFFEGMD